MASVTRSSPHFVSPPGHEVTDKCELSEDVSAGDLLAYTGAMSAGQPVMQKCPTGDEPDGIALKDGKSGKRGFDVGIVGEMDGFSGLSPGADLYASTTTPGDIDDASGSGTAAPIKAVRKTRIRFSFV